MVTIYRNKNYKIFDNCKKHEYIIWNTHKEFQDGHVHINNYNTAKNIIKFAVNHKVPYSKSKYILQSLIRLSDRKEYTELLQEKMNTV